MTDEQPNDILSHLQAAAKELIAAGRGILDVADDVISDRLRLLGVFVGEPPAEPTPKPSPKVEKIEVERVERDEPA